MSDAGRRIYSQFEFHRKATDCDAQAALDRIARNCLGLTYSRSFNPYNCGASEEELADATLANLVVYHDRDTGYPSSEPIVVLKWNERRFVIEGNNRVNRWRKSGYSEPFPAIVVTPHIPGP